MYALKATACYIQTYGLNITLPHSMGNFFVLPF